MHAGTTKLVASLVIGLSHLCGKLQSQPLLKAGDVEVLRIARFGESAQRVG